MFARQNANPESALSTSCFEVTGSEAICDVAAPGTTYGPGVGVGAGEGVGDGVGEGLVVGDDVVDGTLETDVW